MTREQRTVFGEVAEAYEQYRPRYPEELFDAVVAFGELSRGDRALEVGAGTGRATRAFLARGLDVVAVEPSAGMVDVLRATGAEVVESTFEDASLEPETFGLVYAAQAWHWVDHAVAYLRAARALAAGGTIALFWNRPVEFDGELGSDIDSVYRTHAPHLVRQTERWQLDTTIAEIAASEQFDAVTKRTFPWTQSYTTAEYVALMGTHSDHRMLPDEQRSSLHSAVSDVVTNHGGRVEVRYDAVVYLARVRTSGAPLAAEPPHGA